MSAQCREQRGVPTGDVQSWFLQWPLPDGAEPYADIDGRRMHRDVVAQAEISRRFRDEVPPKYWGRIIGFESDAWLAEWLAGRFRTVGLGSEPDFIERDIEDKAAFTYSMLGAPSERAWRRAAEKGAAAVFDVQTLPGNMRYQAYPSGTEVPAFTLGGADGMAVRDMIASATPGQPVRVDVQLEVEMVPDLQTALVWGTLPGASDETRASSTR